MPLLRASPFRLALLLEILANLSSLPSLFLRPDHALSFLVQGPAQITPATRTLARAFGGLVTALTVPLVLSWPQPRPGPAGDAQRAFRRAAYITLGAGEVCLFAVAVAQWVVGESGMTDAALLGTAAIMGGAVGMRALFLVGRPEWLEGRDDEGKKTR